MVVHPARGHREDTLAQLLAPLLGGGEAERAGIVHRLDRDTSGLLVRRAHGGGAARLQAALADRLIEREYLALVEGRPPARIGHDRGADRPRPARAHAHGRRRRRRSARRARTSRSSARSRTPRCCACDWRPDAPIRSACTCRRSAIPCAATPSTAPPGCWGWSASSCTRRAWRSRIRSAVSRRGAARRCPPICRARWRAPNGYPKFQIETSTRAGTDRGPARSDDQTVAGSGSAPSTRKSTAYNKGVARG